MTEERKTENTDCCLKWQAQKYCCDCSKAIKPREKPGWYTKTPRLPVDNIGTESRPPRVKRCGRVYFIRSGETSHIKIGKTAGEVPVRVRGLSTGNPEYEEIVKYVEADDYEALERRLHAFLDMYRGKGEWFIIVEGDIDNAIGLCFDWIADVLCVKHNIGDGEMAEIKNTVDACRALPGNTLGPHLRYVLAESIRAVIAGTARVVALPDSYSADAKRSGAKSSDARLKRESKARTGTRTRKEDVKVEDLTPAQQTDKIMGNLGIYKVGEPRKIAVTSGAGTILLYANQMWSFADKSQYRKYCDTLVTIPMSSASIHHFAVSNKSLKKYVIMYQACDLRGVTAICAAAESFGWVVEVCMYNRGGVIVVTNNRIKYGSCVAIRNQVCGKLKQMGYADVERGIYDPSDVDFGHCRFPLTFTVYNHRGKGELTVGRTPLSLLM